MPEIQKVSARHVQIMDFILANPTAKMGEVAAAFNVTPSWLSTIIHSHAFQDQLARKQEEMFDSGVLQPLGVKLTAAADLTLDKYMEKLETMDANQLGQNADKLLGRMGYGSQGGGTTINGNVNIQQNSVPPDVLKEARDRIGKAQMGEANSQAALPGATPEQGTEIEGVAVREGS